jgi:hypothetical protein
MSTSTLISIKGIEQIKAQSSLKEFRSLFKKYSEGRQWLIEQYFRGKDIEHDMEDFIVLVIKPMQTSWFSLSGEDKEAVKRTFCPEIAEDKF